MPLGVNFIKDGPRKLHLKFGQNLVSNSGDIPVIDKCHLDKMLPQPMSQPKKVVVVVVGVVVVVVFVGVIIIYHKILNLKFGDNWVNNK